jgi:hypothetical protein
VGATRGCARVASPDCGRGGRAPGGLQAVTGQGHRR